MDLDSLYQEIILDHYRSPHHAGLRDPYLACTPMVVFTGGPYPQTRHRNSYQEIEDRTLFEPVTKYNVAAVRAKLEGKPMPPSTQPAPVASSEPTT